MATLDSRPARGEVAGLVALTPLAAVLRFSTLDLQAFWQVKKQRDREPFEFETACRRWAGAMDTFSQVRTSNDFKRLKLVRYEDLVEDFDPTFEQVCTFAGIQPFRPRPSAPNSSFPDGSQAGDFDGRWHSWSRARRRTFQRHAGRQLREWGYES